ncbi:hypothetical protein [Dactylosporangium sp. CA-233914]|uniref:hypothetical protein n=1 Tax=Dactylosporangium sp. CA-233914 TaxID=3239934 RepID=UPI003D8EDAA2
MRIVNAFLVGVMLVLAAACQNNSGDSATPRVSLAPGAHPYDALRGAEFEAMRHAVQRLRNKCLAGEGFPQNLELMATQPGDPFEFLRVDDGMFGP